jgi:lysophospholipase L1-like esterase
LGWRHGHLRNPLADHGLSGSASATIRPQPKQEVPTTLPDTEMQSDGIHYTANGYAILAERVLPLVLSALQR